MDRVSDEFLDLTIRSCLEIMKENKSPSLTYYHAQGVLRIATELKARREAERRPDPISQALNEGEGTYRP